MIIKTFNKRIILSLVLSFAFFLASIFTISDYGVSWDEELHFSRGNAYLNFFLTGKKEYTEDDKKSFYQLDYQNGDFWLKEKGGHPPINGILAASFNAIFYRNLGLLSDIHSYHLFNIVISTFLVFVVTFFAIDALGFFPGLITFLSLVTYPLFFSESHFNVKDPAETAFFAATIWAFYKFLETKKIKWYLFFFIFFAFGLGVKFNILFVPFILLPYFLIKYKSKISVNNFNRINLKLLFFTLVGFVLVFTIFFGTWPNLWYGFPGSFADVFSYYRQIGTGTNYQGSNFYILGFNTFPILWIIFTSPPYILFLSSVGLMGGFFIKQKKGLHVLWLLWLVVPILRVSIPGSSVYGGIRQIMEFLPALALFSGLGSYFLIDYFRKRKMMSLLVKILLLALFIWPVFVLVKMHPNENVYFNSLIGGLKGAEERQFPSYGNSYGNAYLQGINWLNKNAEPDSNIALIQGTETNTPAILYRKDLYLRNSNWSGVNRKGEYLMDLTFNDTGKAFFYTWEYVDKFLIPVYEVRVDQVSILKIWKNDLLHTKPEFRKEVKRYQGSMEIETGKGQLLISLGEVLDLSDVKVKYRQDLGCDEVKGNFVETSEDSKNWQRERDLISQSQIGNTPNVIKGEFDYYFASRKAKYVKFIFDSVSSCALNSPLIDINIFE